VRARVLRVCASRVVAAVQFANDNYMLVITVTMLNGLDRCIADSFVTGCCLPCALHRGKSAEKEGPSLEDNLGEQPVSPAAVVGCSCGGVRGACACQHFSEMMRHAHRRSLS
jgi:hypothetical protein